VARTRWAVEVWAHASLNRLVSLSHVLHMLQMLLLLLQSLLVSHANESLDFVVADYTIVVEI